MLLPYLTPKTNILPRFADIGFDPRNYTNERVLNNAHFLIGKGNREQLKPIYEAGNARLESAPSYGVSQSAQQIIDANPNMQVHSGDVGNQMLAHKSRETRGTHARVLVPAPGQLPHITLIRDELDNLKALQTLGHETGHYRMGHSTVLGTTTMPEGIRGRNNTNIALKEIEAESTAVALMNRLGYGYAPGLTDRSSAYIGRFYDDLPPQLQTPQLSQRVIDQANKIATQLIPEPIRRFGPSLLESLT